MSVSSDMFLYVVDRFIFIIIFAAAYHDCSGTASQVTPQGRQFRATDANATGGKGRVRTGDRLHLVLCLYQLGQKDIPIYYDCYNLQYFFYINIKDQYGREIL